MKQWEIYNFPYPAGQTHPCVVISNQAIIDNPDYEFINCLLCVSRRAGVELKPFHVRLNGADGLDATTVAKCNQIHFFPNADTGVRRGVVSHARRQAIGGKLIRIFGLSG